MRVASTIASLLFPGDKARLTVLDKDGRPRAISPREAKKTLDEIHRANLDCQIAGPRKNDKSVTHILKSIIREIFNL